MIAGLRLRTDRLRMAVVPAAAGLRQRLTLWVSARSLREQRLLAVLAVVAALAILVFGIVRPLQSMRAQAIADIGRYDALDARLRAAGPLTGQAAVRAGAPETMIPAAAQALGLSIQRIEPEGGGIRVALADQPFEAVVGWLAQLDAENGIQVSELKIDRKTPPGRIDAQVLFAR